MSVPIKIGRYHVVRRLGAGAFATVWLAEDDVLESPVAIKVLADNWAHHADVRARFEQEAQVLRRADSDRLVRVHDLGELPDGRPYQVMTYAAGGTLAERLASGPMPVDAALRTAVDIARAVTVLHGSGVLHRDLKPSNVLFDTVRGVERVLVADLGLAKEIAHASGFTVVAGTSGYMAPEQRLPGGGLDVRADVHAIGVMVYEMLTGHLPHAGPNRDTATGSAPAPPSKLRPQVPREVDRVVLRALHVDRERRWPTATALASALVVAAGTRPRRRRAGLRRFGRAVGVVAAVTAIAAAGGSTDPSSPAAGWVRVADATGVLSVDVPVGWAGQLKDAGWDPAAIRLPARRGPGLLVGADLGTWPDPLSGRPGVFAGVSDSSAGMVLPAHDRCTRQPDRPVRMAGVTGRLQRWTDCAGTSISYSEAVSTTPRGRALYVQIKQIGPPDRTDEVLRSVRVDQS